MTKSGSRDAFGSKSRSGANGTFYEVTPWNAVIWEYVNPYSGQTPKGESNEVFTIRYYAPDHPGLAGVGV